MKYQRRISLDDSEREKQNPFVQLWRGCLLFRCVDHTCCAFFGSVQCLWLVNVNEILVRRMTWNASKWEYLHFASHKNGFDCYFFFVVWPVSRWFLTNTLPLSLFSAVTKFLSAKKKTARCMRSSVTMRTHKMTDFHFGSVKNVMGSQLFFLLSHVACLILTWLQTFSDTKCELERTDRVGFACMNRSCPFQNWQTLEIEHFFLSPRLTTARFSISGYLFTCMNVIYDFILTWLIL